jgi:uncharacterized protein YgiM (DUF1202 family)
MKRALILLSLFIIGVAHAARRAKVDVDNTEMYRGPQKDSEVLTHLKKGQRLTASNYPTEGFYKVRTVDGMIGWVKADTLNLGPMPDLTKIHSSGE